MRVLAGLLVMLAAGLPAAAASTPQHTPIGYVKVLRVIQQPYQPLKFRIAMHVLVGYKIFDIRGRSVYSQAKDDLVQPYSETSLTVTWSKRGSDGIPVPRGRAYLVKPGA